MVAGVLLDPDDVVDGQRLRPASLTFVAAAALVMASDGYDLSSLGYVAPELLKAWRLPPAGLVPAFSAGILGMMIGGPLLGMLGDRYGRKPVIVGGLASIGMLDLLTTGVRGVAGLVALRFLTGLMVGGVIPNVGALMAELTPRRIRGRILVLVTMGVVVGIAAPGLVANRLVPAFGWRSILLVGAAGQLLVAALVAAAIPESLKFLIGRERGEARALRVARRLRPDLTLGAGLRFALPTQGGPRGSVRPLFAGGLALVTPLLWLCQAANQMANFFALTWLPTLLQAAGAGTASAGATASLFAIGGLGAGGLLLLVIDQLGVAPLLALFLVGAPLVAGMAQTGLPPGLHALVIAGAGFCVTGIQCGLTALLGLLYPTAIRSVGTGWTQAAGRLGALAAPVVGGVLLGLHVRMDRLPLAPAALLLIGGGACLVLTVACRRRFGHFGVGEFALAERAPAPDPVAGTV